jgi:hypothetical protein
MQVSRLILVWLVVMSSALAWGTGQKREWMGVYLQGQKIGFSESLEETVEWRGRSVMRTTSSLRVGTQMLGSAMQISVDTVGWFEKGRVLRSETTMSSAGRKLTTSAEFFADRVEASMISESGEDSRVLMIPKGKRVLTDPVEILEMMPSLGAKADVLVFSPESLALVEASVEVLKPTLVKVKGVEVMATGIVVSDPRAPSTVYVSGKGDLLKITGPMGLEMIPESELEAKSGAAGSVQVDLASASRVTPEGEVVWGSKKVILEVRGLGNRILPTDSRQKALAIRGGFRLDLGLDLLPDQSARVDQVKKDRAEWLVAEPRVPVGDEAIRSLVKDVVGPEKRVSKIAAKVHAYVFGGMRVNAGIGVMRDAREILKTKEGVCRDYAILTGTMLRAAGVPTKFANGLVLYQGAYYYHAWVEYWDGKNWIGLDTTRPDLRLGTGYIKTAQGTAAQALQGFLLDGATIKVIQG